MDLRNRILGTPLVRASLDLPALGGEIWIRAMTIREREQYEASPAVQAAVSSIHAGESKEDIEAAAMDKNRGARAAVAIMGIIDPETGSNVFAEEDIEKVQELDGDALTQVFYRVLQLSGLLGDTAEDAEKNSDDAPQDDSSSVSPFVSGGPLESSSLA